MKNWDKIKLGDLCEVITKGTTPTSIGYNFTDSGIKFIKVESLTESGEIIPNKVAYIDEACHQALKRSQLKKNDILFSIAGALGRIGIVKEDILPANTNQALAIIRLKKDSNALVEFIAKYFNSNIVTDEIEKLRIGAAQQNLSLTQLNNLFVPLPPLPEQLRIVSILDTAGAAITSAKANAQQNLKNAKELFESYLQGVFENGNWEKKKILDLCDGKENIVGGPFGSNLKVEHYKNDGVPILRLQNIGKGYFIDKDIKYVSEEKAKELEYHSFQSGDLALAKLGIPIGKTCIIPDDFEFGIVVADVVRIRPNKNKVDYNFLNYFLNTNLSVSQLTGNISGATRPRVNLDDVRNIIVSIPPLKDQQTIVRQLDALRVETQKLEAVYQKKIDDLEELKKSILHKAFSGGL